MDFAFGAANLCRLRHLADGGAPGKTHVVLVAAKEIQVITNSSKQSNASGDEAMFAGYHRATSTPVEREYRWKGRSPTRSHLRPNSFIEQCVKMGTHLARLASPAGAILIRASTRPQTPATDSRPLSVRNPTVSTGWCIRRRQLRTNAGRNSRLTCAIECLPCLRQY